MTDPLGSWKETDAHTKEKRECFVVGLFSMKETGLKEIDKGPNVLWRKNKGVGTFTLPTPKESKGRKPVGTLSGVLT